MKDYDIACAEPIGGITINWCANGVGFGQLYFYTKEGKTRISSELMGKDFIKAVLCKMVDDAELE